MARKQPVILSTIESTSRKGTFYSLKLSLNDFTTYCSCPVHFIPSRGGPRNCKHMPIYEQVLGGAHKVSVAVASALKAAGV